MSQVSFGGCAVASREIYLIVPAEVGEDRLCEALDRREWSNDRIGPGVVRATKDLEDETDLHSELAGIQYLLPSRGGLSDATRVAAMNPFVQVLAPSAPPPEAGSKPVSPPEGVTNNGAQAQGSPSDGAPADGETAKIVDEGLAAIGIPSKLWEKNFSDDPRKKLSTILDDLLEARATYARSTEWVFAPERQLLDEVVGSLRPTVARRMLETREGLTEHQVAGAWQDVELKRKAVDQQQAAIDIFVTANAQMKKWTWLADWGVAILYLSVGFAIAMTVWLMILVGNKTVSAWTLPAAVFAFALFAAAPAVLLLRERPLKGIDNWMPGGGSAKKASKESAAESSGGKKAGSKTSSNSAEPDAQT
jgi:hypothetical protein